jgi:hypothetical protein
LGGREPDHGRDGRRRHGNPEGHYCKDRRVGIDLQAKCDSSRRFRRSARPGSHGPKPLKARFKKVEILRTSELYDLAKENARFRRRVFKTNATTLLNDMLIESYAMDHKIEEIIKARGR